MSDHKIFRFRKINPQDEREHMEKNGYTFVSRSNIASTYRRGQFLVDIYPSGIASPRLYKKNALVFDRNFDKHVALYCYYLGYDCQVEDCQREEYKTLLNNSRNKLLEYLPEHEVSELTDHYHRFVDGELVETK